MSLFQLLHLLGDAPVSTYPAVGVAEQPDGRAADSGNRTRVYSLERRFDPSAVGPACPFHLLASQQSVCFYKPASARDICGG